jgi:hypothetical protein
LKYRDRYDFAGRYDFADYVLADETRFALYEHIERKIAPLMAYVSEPLPQDADHSDYMALCAATGRLQELIQQQARLLCLYPRLNPTQHGRAGRQVVECSGEGRKQNRQPQGDSQKR